jgi:dTDP-4-dehydrorhamnose reductase
MSRIRIAVTGSNGQIVRSLVERSAGTPCDIVCIGRPALDLGKVDTIDSALSAIAADVLVSAAAYTEVNKAEAEPDVADLINGRAPGVLAARADALGIPLIHLSTDYVFDGTKSNPYTERDPICPINAYGRSKAAGERAVAAAHPRHVILRTSWVYSPLNRNFVTTMLVLARKQDKVRVVADQIGNPTAAADVADGILAVVRNLMEGRGEDRYGTFHMAADGAATWAEFATAVFSASAERGGPSAHVVPIASAEYQSPAQRPANSRLDCAKLARVHGVALPHWQASLGPCVGRILEQGA